MIDDEPPTPAASAQTTVLAGPTEEPLGPPVAETNPQPRRRWSPLEIMTVVISALLAVGVVVIALDMKFEADQARWQQRQTCLEWYRLQADYRVGPWYQKLPDAASDCGGGVNDDGIPLVPGGKLPAVEPGEDRYVPHG